MKVIFIFLITGLISFSCKNNVADKRIDQSEINEKFMLMNRKLIENESKKINDFIKARSFNTTLTGTGLRYQIYKHGNGEKPGVFSDVEIIYKVFLLDGTLCYSSDSSSPTKIRLGVGEQVRGLEEGILLMLPGDKARLILPSHLAYGMSGDQGKIPPGSALFYEVELLKTLK